jgi:hypothetical protein
MKTSAFVYHNSPKDQHLDQDLGEVDADHPIPPQLDHIRHPPDHTLQNGMLQKPPNDPQASLRHVLAELR